MAFVRNIGSPKALLALGAAVMVTLAACGGGGGTAGAAGATAALEEELIDYTECLRDQGINVEDPVVEPDGSVRLGQIMMTPPPDGRGERGGPGSDGPGGGFGRMGEAREACGQPPAGAFGTEQVDASEMQDAALAFAQCMRDNGVDMPDPDFGGGLGGRGVTFQGGNVDQDDPNFQAAQEECRPLLPGGGEGGGMMRGGPGGGN
jgi:hypothetical protein